MQSQVYEQIQELFNPTESGKTEPESVRELTDVLAEWEQIPAVETQNLPQSPKPIELQRLKL